MTLRHLPAPFADFERFVAEWALPTERERYNKLHRSSLEELKTFYDAMLPRLDEVLLHLNQYTVGAMPTDAQTLYELAMTFAETAHPLDLGWKGVDFNDAYPWERFEFRSVSCNPS